MRKITEQAWAAMNERREFKQGNTKVCKTYDGRMLMYLHGHLIAELGVNNQLRITNCGYFTVTTKERLNGCKRINIRQKRGVWYLNGKEWDGLFVSVR